MENNFFIEGKSRFEDMSPLQIGDLATQHVIEMSNYWASLQKTMYASLREVEAVSDSVRDNNSETRRKAQEAASAGDNITDFLFDAEAVGKTIIERFYPPDAAETLYAELSPGNDVDLILRYVFCMASFYTIWRRALLKDETLNFPLGLLLHMTGVSFVLNFFASALTNSKEDAIRQTRIHGAKRNKIDLKSIPRKKLIQDFFLSKGPGWILGRRSQSEIANALRTYAKKQPSTGDAPIAKLTDLKDRQMKQFLGTMLASREFPPEIEAALLKKFPSKIFK